MALVVLTIIQTEASWMDGRTTKQNKNSVLSEPFNGVRVLKYFQDLHEGVCLAIDTTRDIEGGFIPLWGLCYFG